MLKNYEFKTEKNFLRTPN